MLHADQKTYSVELLMKQDQMSMSTSIESRVPFLDHTFVEFAMRVPDHLKMRIGTQKYKRAPICCPRELFTARRWDFRRP
jgi:asparagine synthase (glutamine-hydrolysing)